MTEWLIRSEGRNSTVLVLSVDPGDGVVDRQSDLVRRAEVVFLNEID